MPSESRRPMGVPHQRLSPPDGSLLLVHMVSLLKDDEVPGTLQEHVETACHLTALPSPFTLSVSRERYGRVKELIGSPAWRNQTGKRKIACWVAGRLMQGVLRDRMILALLAPPGSTGRALKLL